MSDEEEQEDEQLALSSIFDEDLFKTYKEGEFIEGELNAYPVLPEQFTVTLTKQKKDGELVSEKRESHNVRYLPPIVLNFQLPHDYPSTNPPQYTLTCKWLHRLQLSDVCEKLDSLWEENTGSVILFMWNAFLQDELLDYLNITSPFLLPDFIKCESQSGLDDRAVQNFATRDQLLHVILENNNEEKLKQFEKSFYTCKVCYSEKSGGDCLMFDDCEHVYCKDCMKEYFTIQIKDGNVKGLECPDDKCESVAHPGQVKKLVSEELFARYDRLLLQTSLDTMSDVTFCPRPMCQVPVLMEKDSSMASCPQCRYVFCSLCRLGYHGVSPCRMKADGFQKLREEWLNGNDKTRAILEKRYGKVTIQHALEESFTTQWLNEHSKQCPSCGSHIQKIDGCNKMTCMKCRAYFCWLCNETLSRANPYLHYSTMGSTCLNRLFEGADLGFDDDEFDEFGEEDLMF